MNAAADIHPYVRTGARSLSGLEMGTRFLTENDIMVAADGDSRTMASSLPPTTNGTSPDFALKAPQPDPRDSVIVISLLGVIVVLFVVLVYVSISPMMAYIRRRIPVSQKRIDRRYRTIEGWLITKKVQPHSKICKQLKATKDILGGGCSSCGSLSLSSLPSSDSPSPASQQRPAHQNTALADVTATSMGTSVPMEAEHLQDTSMETDVETLEEEPLDDTDGVLDGDSEMLDSSNGSTSSNDVERECPICMEEFQVGDIVSWSADVTCGHVFHHACIKEWLLRKMGCPFCRTVFLPVDRHRPENRARQGSAFTSQDVTRTSDFDTIGAAHGNDGASTPTDMMATPSITTVPSNDSSDALTTNSNVATDSVEGADHVHGEGSSNTREESSRNTKRLTGSVLRQLTRERAQRYRTTFYCVAEGLVTVGPRRLTSLSPQELACIGLQRQNEYCMEVDLVQRKTGKRRFFPNLHHVIPRRQASSNSGSGGSEPSLRDGNHTDERHEGNRMVDVTPRDTSRFDVIRSTAAECSSCEASIGGMEVDEHTGDGVAHQGGDGDAMQVVGHTMNHTGMIGVRLAHPSRAGAMATPADELVVSSPGGEEIDLDLEVGISAEHSERAVLAESGREAGMTNVVCIASVSGEEGIGFVEVQDGARPVELRGETIQI